MKILRVLIFVFCGEYLNNVEGLIIMEKPTTKAAIPAKTYIVNLDLPPQERWNNVIKHFDPNILKQGLNTLFKEYLPSQQLVPILEDVAKDLERYIPQPFADELRGLSKALGMKLGDLVLINIIYDVSAFNSSQIKACTSIVAYDSMGRILHGRNLDYKVGDYLRELTLQVDYQRGGKTLYMATTYAGYIGVITGSKPNAFSITGDQRNTGSILQNLFSAVDHSWPTFFAERRVLEEASDYQSALSQIMKAPTIAPVYFIISGIKAGEGAIVVRDGRKVANVTTLSQSAHSWYIVETNYDPWVQAPATDDRRDAAINAMNKLGRKNMNPQQLYKVLSVDLVFNSDTTYTTIMSAADASVYQTMIRYDAPPSEELINT